MSTSAKSLIQFLSATVAVIVLAAALNFVVDPLQYFRPARLFAAMYSPDSRMQDAGLIESQSFDTILMGTSLAIHFRQSDIDHIVGGRSLKMRISIFRPISIAETPKASRAICSAAPWRANPCGFWRARSRRLNLLSPD